MAVGLVTWYAWVAMSDYNDVVRAAQALSPYIMERLMEVVEDPDASARDRIAAASKILAVATSGRASEVTAKPLVSMTPREQVKALEKALAEARAMMQ